MKFIEENLAVLTAAMMARGSLFNESDNDNIEMMNFISKMDRPSLPGQVASQLAIYKSIAKYGFAFLNGEPGVGKTQSSITVAGLLSKYYFKRGTKNLFMTDGAKHLQKMERECRAVLGQSTEVFVIDKAMGGTRKSKGQTFISMQTALEMEAEPGKTLFFLVSKDTARRTYTKKVVKTTKCPDCGVKFGEMVLDPETGKRKARILLSNTCSECGSKLTTSGARSQLTTEVPVHKSRFSNNKGLKPIISIGEYARKKVKHKRAFDLLIVDEAHNMKSGASLQGKAMRDLIKVSRKTLLMTGTLSNGYASSLYFLLYALMPQRMKEWGFDIKKQGLLKFIDAYGARKYASKKGKRSIIMQTSELPVISEKLAIDHLAPFTAWIKMEDLNYPMPSYKEYVILAELEDETDQALKKARSEIRELQKVHDIQKTRSMALVQAMTYIPNNPTIKYTLDIKKDGEVVDSVEIPAIFTEDKCTNKERKLVEEVQKQLQRNRKIMVYTAYSVSQTTERLKEVLAREIKENINIKILPANIKSADIESWIEKNPADVLILPYKRVATGMDIPQYPTIIFYELGMNVTDIQQAARRSWRAVIQKNPVEVFFIANTGYQALTLELLSQKIAASKSIEGALASENGLESMTMDSMEIELMKRLVEDVSKLVELDFATEEIPAGRLRPWTVFEQSYIDIVAEFNPSKLKNINPVDINNQEGEKAENEKSAEEDDDGEKLATLKGHVVKEKDVQKKSPKAPLLEKKGTFYQPSLF